MKYAICNETFQDWPFEKAFAYAKSLGYDALEFAPFTINDNAYEISAEERSGIRALADQHELEIIGLHWLLAKTEGYYLTSPDEDVRQRTADYFCELARLCRDLGGYVMVLGSPQQRNLLPGISHDQGLDYAADVIKRADDVLKECNVTIAVEPLSPAEGDFLNTADQGADLVSRVDSENCLLHLDVKAMSSMGEPIDGIIRKHADITAHFHANDANLRGPGMGDVDFLPIMQALKDTGYDSWVSVEVFDYEPGIETLASESIKHLLEIESQLQ
jgi:sugar phosphate isomerase/epimerase